MMKMKVSSTSKVQPTVIGDGQSSGIGFGAMSIAAFYGAPIPDEDAVKLFKAVYAAGCRHFDTAEIYKSGNPFADSDEDVYSESMLSKFLKTVPRDSYTIATKYLPMKWGNKCDYETVKTSLTNSLSRLELDNVDLYYCHRIPSLEASIEFAQTCKRLKEEGLIKEFGLSEIGPKWLRKVHEEAGPVGAIQQEWSLLTRNLEEDLVPTCKELGIPIVAYSPLSRNILACKLETVPNDWRATLPRYQENNLKKNGTLLSDVVGSISDKYKCTTAQLSLAWLFKKAHQLGVVVIPIPGTTKVAHALSNIESTKIDISDESDMKILDGLAINVVGERGDEGYIQMGFESQE